MSDTLKIVIWNINSVRARIELVERFLTEEAPDVLCLQETKVRDEQFPEGVFRRLGYNHQILNGMPMHHGVAMISRVPLHKDERHDWQANDLAMRMDQRSTSPMSVILKINNMLDAGILANTPTSIVKGLKCHFDFIH